MKKEFSIEVNIRTITCSFVPVFNEFGEDGGPSAKEWAPKLSRIKRKIDGIIGKNDWRIDAKAFIAATIFLKGLGGLLFVLGSSFGAYILIYYMMLTAPLLYDFYNYDVGGPNFFRTLNEFLQCMALVGALLYYLGMKGSIARRQLRKKAPRPKTA